MINNRLVIYNVNFLAVNLVYGHACCDCRPYVYIKYLLCIKCRHK